MEKRPIPVACCAARLAATPTGADAPVLGARNILKGTRGPYGGYELARDRSAVTLSDILPALDAVDPEDQPRSETITTIVPVLSLAEQAFAKAFSQMTVDDLVRYAKAVEMNEFGLKTPIRASRGADGSWVGQGNRLSRDEFKLPNPLGDALAASCFISRIHFLKGKVISRSA
jgi:Rrf2 family iron-sulfur cluster assembly transcriptional regulator